MNFETGDSDEIYALDDVLPCSIDFAGLSHEIWLSDAAGVVSHIDIRVSKTAVRRWQLSSQKIGSISVNPTWQHAILCASNDRSMK